jgi:asparagine synthase (glutamine-hydrolysing)
MCGIVGIASREPLADRGLLERMRDEITHRGPDDAGTWFSTDCRVGLAERRLAIIDLSPAGHQPMTDVDGRAWIAFNGEIYNYQILRRELEELGHRFRTATDTEVILEAYKEWGADCLERLNGMFAFALFDVEARRLFLARDRAGEKPLFYRHALGKFAFASELKALMVDPGFPRRVGRAALEAYLTYGYVPGGGCIFEGTHKLPQGHCLTYELDPERLRVWAYWKLPPPSPHPKGTTEELVGELEELLLDSVRLRLIADVPVGVMLSGGIDSSLVTAMAARASSAPVKTFTISFPGHREDEAPFARTVARHFGTEHVELAAEPATVDLLPLLARQFDEPMADSSMVPTYLVSRLIRQHAKVALGGDGGDELFAGYPHYGWVLRQARVSRVVPRSLRRLSSAAASALPLGVRGRNYLIGFSDGVARIIAHINLFFDVGSRQRLLAPLGGVAVANGQMTPEEAKERLCRPEESPVQQATAVDFQTYLVDDILVKVDRASMLTSLEVRAPWLDPRIIEMAFSRTPDSVRASNGGRKILPRLLAARLLPKELDLKRKQGFSLPLAAWFRGDWGRFIHGVLDSEEQKVFDRRMVRRLLKGQRRGLANTQRLFALTLFELWRRNYRVSI